MKIVQNTEYISKIQQERIKECMKKFHITGKYMAEKLNYSQQHISYVLNGKRKLTKELAIAMAELFSKCNSKTEYVDMPFYFIPTEEKEKYYDMQDKNGYVKIPFDSCNYIDYHYLLAESDQMELFSSNIDKDIDIDYSFENGIKAILHYYGYDLNIALSPSVTKFKNMTVEGLQAFVMSSLAFDEKATSSIINTNTGEELKLSHVELFQIFDDFSEAIKHIVERRFEYGKFTNIIKQHNASLKPFF